MDLLRKHSTEFCVTLTFLAFATTLVLWLRTGPVWEISTRNSRAGLIIEIHKSTDSEPHFRTILNSTSVAQESDRLSRREFPTDTGTTMSYDETTLPGRWTLVVAGCKVDIMENALIINGERQIAPLRWRPQLVHRTTR